jgi:hypothetical protein
MMTPARARKHRRRRAERRRRQWLRSRVPARLELLESTGFAEFVSTVRHEQAFHVDALENVRFMRDVAALGDRFVWTIPVADFSLGEWRGRRRVLTGGE